MRVEFFGDEIERLQTLHAVTGEILTEDHEVYVFPATHYVAGPARMERAIRGIETELEQQVAHFEKQGKLLEAQRLRMRTSYDVEMMRQVGSCSGIENYSMHIDGRARGSAPNCLLDYFPEDFVLVVDESHVAVPQIGGMYEGDMSRKRNLVDHGFRLPSAMDNRPLRWEEFLDRIGQTIYLSATPGDYEISKGGGIDNVVEQIIRPTGLVDPEVIVKPTKGQIDDLMGEIHARVERNERVLVTTLTKKMSEDLTDYLLENGIRTRYLHSEVDTLKRIELLRDLRLGEYDVLVGINLLREGLDLPEVSLVAILDADKEGFLRSDKSLIQTIGRAARNVSGQVLMYADKTTASMESAIDETNRRRDKQIAFNRAHGVDPQPLRKKIADITEMLAREDENTQELLATWGQGKGKQKVAPVPGLSKMTERMPDVAGLPSSDLADLVQQLTEQMHAAAAELQFEVAARLRDEISELKKELRQMMEATQVTIREVQVTFDCADPAALSGVLGGGARLPARGATASLHQLAGGPRRLGGPGGPPQRLRRGERSRQGRAAAVLPEGARGQDREEPRAPRRPRRPGTRGGRSDGRARDRGRAARRPGRLPPRAPRARRHRRRTHHHGRPGGQ